MVGRLWRLGSVVAVLVSACSDDPTPLAGTDQGTGSDEAGSSGDDERADFSDIPDLVDEVQPSVVAIVTDVGEGSGVIYDDDGAVVTNAHVVAEARTVDVTFADGSRADGEVVAADPATDLAVIRTDRDDLEAAEFSDRTPVVGELAVAIGNPLGLENSVTAGIVSGLERSVPGGGTALVGLLQTDAAISPGNSGGALVGPSGGVIGINVAYIPPAGGAVSIGFAIPAGVVVNVADELLDEGHVEHAFLGIALRALTPQLAEQYGIDTEAGVLVIDVVPGGPADEAGVRAGDVITGINGETVAEPGDLAAELRASEPGDRVELRLLRNGEEETFEVELGEAPPAEG
ncbi:MAG TPA: trypsin-like peptidase domain-containing protein [Acidimicrobiales bacterium]|nr:trypsin-like peptidase domain-containing protein [Acidimicrobiales bacterium]